MFDFPSSPALNAVYTSGGKTYVWDGQKWKQRPNAEGYTARTANSRNLIVNPAMQVSQENGAAVGTTDAYHPVDQWMWSAVTSGTYNVAMLVTTPTPSGGATRIQVTASAVDASIAATDYAAFFHRMEGNLVAGLNWGQALPYAKPAVLRFAAIGVAGNYCVALRNGASDRSIVFPFTLTTTGQYEVKTIAIPAMIGGTPIPTNNTRALELVFTVMAGSNTRTPTPGVWSVGGYIADASIGNMFAVGGYYFGVADVGLYVDPDGTGIAPPFEVPNFADELLRCKRYWQKTTTYWSGTTVSAAGYYPFYKYTTPPRAAPTLSGINQLNGGFVATVGALADLPPFDGCVETRAANAATVGVLRTDIIVNARM